MEKSPEPLWMDRPASYVASNLTMSDIYLAYICNSPEPFIVVSKFRSSQLDTSFKVIWQTLIKSEKGTALQYVKYFLHKKTWRLLVLLPGSFKIYDENCSRVIHSFVPPLGGDSLLFLSGMAFLEQFNSVYIAASNGEVYGASGNGEKSYKCEKFDQHHGSGLSCLTGIESEGKIVLSDENCSLFIYKVTKTGLEMFGKADLGLGKSAAVTCMVTYEKKAIDNSKFNYVLCGLSNGSVAILSTMNNDIVVTFGSNGSMISSIDVLKETKEVAIGGEDGVVNVWSMQFEEDIVGVKHRVSKGVNERLVTGLVAVGSHSILATLYDSNEIAILNV